MCALCQDSHTPQGVSLSLSLSGRTESAGLHVKTRCYMHGIHHCQLKRRRDVTIGAGVQLSSKHRPSALLLLLPVSSPPWLQRGGEGRGAEPVSFPSFLSIPSRHPPPFLSLPPFIDGRPVKGSCCGSLCMIHAVVVFVCVCYYHFSPFSVFLISSCPLGALSRGAWSLISDNA